MTHDFKAALDWVELVLEPPNFALDCISDWERKNFEACRRALLIADALMGEPTVEMEIAGEELDGTYYGIDNMSEIFKAMRDKMLEEIK